MATATEKTILTPAEYKAKGAQVRELISSWNLCLDAQIDDYPIGRRDRGKCRLQVERAKGKGYRTVRTTTNKRGVWCKPKKSVFHDGVIVVATNLPSEYDHNIQWLYADTSGVSVGGASYGRHHQLILAPCYSKPSREARTYTMQSSSFALFGDGTITRTEEKQTIEADPTELCDSYDAWLEEYQILRALVLETWKDA